MRSGRQKYNVRASSLPPAVTNGDSRYVMGMGGTFVEVTPPSRIVHVEIFDVDWTGGETRVTTELTEAGGVTTMTMTVRYSSEAAREAALTTGMTSRMEMSYARLDALLAA